MHSSVFEKFTSDYSFQIAQGLSYTLKNRLFTLLPYTLFDHFSREI